MTVTFNTDKSNTKPIQVGNAYLNHEVEEKLVITYLGEAITHCLYETGEVEKISEEYAAALVGDKSWTLVATGVKVTVDLGNGG